MRRAGRMRPSAYYDRMVDVMEELFKVTMLMRERTGYLTDRYSERSERAMQTIDRQIRRILRHLPPAGFRNSMSAENLSR